MAFSHLGIKILGSAVQLKHMENSRIDICHCFLASFRFNYQTRNLTELQRTVENLPLFSSLSFFTLVMTMAVHANQPATIPTRVVPAQTG
jgi:hypothetical protein